MDTLTDVNNRLGGVHQVVDENNFIVFFYIISDLFLMGNRLRTILSTSVTYKNPLRMSTMSWLGGANKEVDENNIW